MSDFLNASKSIVTDFLQNVIIIDDEAYSEINSTPQIIHVNTPVGRGVKADFSSVNTVEFTPEAQTLKKEHRVDIKVLTDNFASQGLLCSVLRPEQQEVDFVEKTKTLLKKADIIVLDWNIEIDGKASDETVKELILSIVSDENKHQQKSMRYIAIYSGEDNLDSKIEELKSILDELIGISGNIVDKYKLIYDHLQINIYAKESQKSNTDPDIKISEDQLADKIINDFTNFVMGLTPSMALRSLAEIRRNTHRVLSVFSKDMDEAYLSHRIMLPEPSDAESFMIDILLAELHSIVEDSSATEPLKVGNIMKWVDNEFDNERYLRIFFNNEIVDHTKTGKHSAMKAKFSLDPAIRLQEATNFTSASQDIVTHQQDTLNKQLEQIFSHGYTENIECQIIKQKKYDPKTFATYLYRNTEIAKKIENKFAVASTIKNKYSQPIPYLSMGTIIKKINRYYICIIPRCDAARIKENEQNFPFLQLVEIEDEKPFDVILKDEEIYKKFKIDYRPHYLFVQSFRKAIKNFDATNKPLYADSVNGKYVFTTHADDCFIWVAEMKKEKAQSIANHFAAQLSRVGFNESEYLRRSYQ